MSEVRLYNSLMSRVEPLKTLKKGNVGLYTCGPTVYDHIHIGNLRTYIFEDTLRRVLRANGLSVTHVMNITDIEDKIFARAQEKKVEFSELTQQYEKIFLSDAEQLNIDLKDSTVIRATDAISEMQALIQKIPNKYVVEDGVYFDITKYPDYGLFVKLDRSHEHHRIRNDEYDKEHVADFALWKAKREGEPSWDFEIDGKNIAGRPGWHIECSAMSTKYLGQPFDIHTGGVDLKFPHHENEVAQAKAASGKDLANTFLHAEHLLVDGKKMSKSLDNFYILDDVKEKGVEPLAFRVLMLQSHYRSQLNFTWESLQGAQHFLQNTLRPLADRQLQPSDDGNEVPYADKLREKLLTTVSDDLNTAVALSILAQLADGEQLLSKDGVKQLHDILVLADELLGLQLAERDDITAAQKKLIEERGATKAVGDFAKADELRTNLAQQHIALNDTAGGTVWFRTDR